jgi:hypothetical protein
VSELRSPSPIITCFGREIRSSLPAAEKEHLATYAPSVAKTTHYGDLKRARQCAEWAVQMAERSSDSHLSHFVKHLEEIRKLEKDTVFGAEFGVMRVGGVGPGQDAEIEWVDDAVAIARTEAQRTGWDSVPWEDLLKQMLVVVAPQEPTAV